MTHATAMDGTGTPAGGDEEERLSGRSRAEWVTLSLSVVIVAGMLLLVTWLSVRGGVAPARIEITPVMEGLRHEADAWYLPVVITNAGDDTVEEAVIGAELDTGDGQPETGEITITFLAGGETVQGTFVFGSDPSQGELTIRAVSYKEP